MAASKRTTTKEKKHKAKKAVASVVVPITAAPSLCDDGTATMDMCGEDADVDGTARGDAGDGDGVIGDSSIGTGVEGQGCKGIGAGNDLIKICGILPESE